MTCARTLGTLLSLFVLAIAIVAGGTYYGNYQHHLYEHAEGRLTERAVSDYPHLASNPKTREGIQSSLKDANELPWFEAFMQTVLESKIYRFYDVNPTTLWCGLGFIFLVLITACYKTYSDYLYYRSKERINANAQQQAFAMASNLACLSDPRMLMMGAMRKQATSGGGGDNVALLDMPVTSTQ
jgi:hypothetical protein